MPNKLNEQRGSPGFIIPVPADYTLKYLETRGVLALVDFEYSNLIVGHSDEWPWTDPSNRRIKEYTLARRKNRK